MGEYIKFENYEESNLNDELKNLISSVEEIADFYVDSKNDYNEDSLTSQTTEEQAKTVLTQHLDELKKANISPIEMDKAISDLIGNDYIKKEEKVNTLGKKNSLLNDLNLNDTKEDREKASKVLNKFFDLDTISKEVFLGLRKGEKRSNIDYGSYIENPSIFYKVNKDVKASNIGIEPEDIISDLCQRVYSRIKDGLNLNLLNKSFQDGTTNVEENTKKDTLKFSKDEIEEIEKLASDFANNKIKLKDLTPEQSNLRQSFINSIARYTRSSSLAEIGTVISRSEETRINSRISSTLADSQQYIKQAMNVLKEQNKEINQENVKQIANEICSDKGIKLKISDRTVKEYFAKEEINKNTKSINDTVTNESDSVELSERIENSKYPSPSETLMQSCDRAEKFMFMANKNMLAYQIAEYFKDNMRTNSNEAGLTKDHVLEKLKIELGINKVEYNEKTQQEELVIPNEKLNRDFDNLINASLEDFKTIKEEFQVEHEKQLKELTNKLDDMYLTSDRGKIDYITFNQNYINIVKERNEQTIADVINEYNQTSVEGLTASDLADQINMKLKDNINHDTSKCKDVYIAHSMKNYEQAINSQDTYISQRSLPDIIQATTGNYEVKVNSNDFSENSLEAVSKLDRFVDFRDDNNKLTALAMDIYGNNTSFDNIKQAFEKENVVCYIAETEENMLKDKVDNKYLENHYKVIIPLDKPVEVGYNNSKIGCNERNKIELFVSDIMDKVENLSQKNEGKITSVNISHVNTSGLYKANTFMDDGLKNNRQDFLIQSQKQFNPTEYCKKHNYLKEDGFVNTIADIKESSLSNTKDVYNNLLSNMTKNLSIEKELKIVNSGLNEITNTIKNKMIELQENARESVENLREGLDHDSYDDRNIADNIKRDQDGFEMA